MEGNETVLEALRREVLEETGCPCDEIRELGVIYENRFSADYTQCSHYFLVTTHKNPTAPPGRIRFASLSTFPQGKV